MPVSTTPADLLAASKCYACIPESDQAAVLIYVLAVQAGLSAQTPAQLMAAAKCYVGIPLYQQQAVMVYLLNQIANGGSGPVTCENLEGAGDPT